MARRVLLFCGIFASLLYVAMNVVVAMQWKDYSSAAQTVSELSAIGAPTRPLWLVLAFPYTLLMAAFGWGVWVSAHGSRPLRVAGGSMIAYGVIGLGWPFAPMHLREVLAAGGGTLTDTLHIAFAMVTVVLMLVAMSFAAAAFGRGFRFYSITSMVVLFAGGALTSMDAPRVQANLPTPWAGVWERINIGVFLLWVIVLAITLLRRREASVTGRGTAAYLAAPEVEGDLVPRSSHDLCFSQHELVDRRILGFLERTEDIHDSGTSHRDHGRRRVLVSDSTMDEPLGRHAG